MISRYRHLWQSDRSIETVQPDQQDSAPSNLVTLILLSVTIWFSLSVGTFLFDSTSLIIILGLFGFIVGSVFITNVTLFVTWMFPFAYLIIRDKSVLVLAALSALSLIAHKLRSGSVTFSVPYPLAIVTIIVTGFIGLSLSLDPVHGKYDLVYSLLTVVLTFLVFYNVDLSTEQIKTFMLLTCVFTAILGWGTLAKYLITGQERLVFGWTSMNRMAGFMGLIIPYSLLMLIKASNIKWRLVWLWIILGVLSGLLVTQTRAIVLSSFLVVFYLGIKDRRAWMVMVSFVVLALLLAPSLFLSRLSMTVGKGDVPDWSSVGRLQIWLNSLEFIPKYFWFGMGLGSFPSIYELNFPYAFIKAIHAHNIYLYWLFCFGIFGMIAHSWVSFGSLWRGHRAVMRTRNSTRWKEESLILTGLNAGVINLLMASMVDTYLFVPTAGAMFWTILAFQLTLARRMADE